MWSSDISVKAFSVNLFLHGNKSLQSQEVKVEVIRWKLSGYVVSCRPNMQRALILKL